MLIFFSNMFIIIFEQVLFSWVGLEEFEITHLLTKFDGQQILLFVESFHVISPLLLVGYVVICIVFEWSRNIIPSHLSLISFMHWYHIRYLLSLSFVVFFGSCTLASWVCWIQTEGSDI